MHFVQCMNASSAHPAGSSPDSKGIDRLDKIIGSDRRRRASPAFGFG
jgi:hypothetical protein